MCSTCGAVADERVARFLGVTTFLPGRAERGRVRCVLGEVSLPGVADGDVCVGLRPGAVRAVELGRDERGGPGESVQGEVLARVHRRDHVRLSVRPDVDLPEVSAVAAMTAGPCRGIGWPCRSTPTAWPSWGRDETAVADTGDGGSVVCGWVLRLSGADGVGDTVGMTADVVGTAIVRNGLLLAQQRAYPPDVAGLWELPGGRVEAGETDVEAVLRECREELGVEVVVGDRVGVDVPLPGGKVLRVFAATLPEGGGQPRAVEHKALRWLSADELAAVDWLPADRVLLPALRELLSGPTGDALFVSVRRRDVPDRGACGAGGSPSFSTRRSVRRGPSVEGMYVVLLTYTAPQVEMITCCRTTPNGSTDSTNAATCWRRGARRTQWGGPVGQTDVGGQTQSRPGGGSTGAAGSGAPRDRRVLGHSDRSGIACAERDTGPLTTLIGITALTGLNGLDGARTDTAGENEPLLSVAPAENRLPYVFSLSRNVSAGTAARPLHPVPAPHGRSVDQLIAASVTGRARRTSFRSLYAVV